MSLAFFLAIYFMVMSCTFVSRAFCDATSFLHDSETSMVTGDCFEKSTGKAGRTFMTYFCVFYFGMIIRIVSETF